MIQRFSILPLLLLLVVFAKAGDSTGVSSSKRVYVGLSFMPGIAYRYLTYNHAPANEPETAFNKDFYNQRNKEEKPIFGFNTGIRVAIKATKFLTVETGIDYAYKGYSTASKNLTFGFSYNPNLSVDSSKLGNFYARYIYHYIDIPVALNFEIGKQKVKCVISTGAYLNFILATSTYSMLTVPSLDIKDIRHTTTTRNNSNYPVCNISPFLGIGIDYNITDMISLRIMPQAQFQALTNLNSYGYMPERLWSAGINMSLFLGFVNAK